MDASALVAILATEPEFPALSEAAQKADTLLVSGLVRWEAVRAICRIDRMGFEEAQRQIAEFVSRFGIETVPIGEREAEIAMEAHRRYGKGNHPAKLNMGDCFAYACAKANDAGLLYKGNDFAQTDLA